MFSSHICCTVRHHKENTHCIYDFLDHLKCGVLTTFYRIIVWLVQYLLPSHCSIADALQELWVLSLPWRLIKSYITQNGVSMDSVPVSPWHYSICVIWSNTRGTDLEVYANLNCGISKIMCLNTLISPENMA